MAAGIRHQNSRIEMPETQNSSSDILVRISRTVVRKQWLILLTAAVVSVGTIGALYHVPNRYMSEATLLVDPQKVPTRYVTPTTETNLADALQAMTQDVLSRARLLKIIEEFGLYTKERQRLAPEEVIELMRSYIKIEPILPVAPTPGHTDINSFKISFVAEKAALAQQVTSKLTSLFIEANLKSREDQATNTTNFLKAQLANAKSNLNAQEETMRDFKAKYLGELPEQQQGNLAILNGTQLQLETLEASLGRAQQQRVYLESMISGYQRLAARGAPVAGPAQGAISNRPLSPLQAAENDLSLLEVDRAKLLTTYSPSYLGVKELDRKIAAAQSIVDKLEAAQKAQVAASATNDGSPSPISPTADTWSEDSSIAQLQSQLEANRLEIQNTQKDEEQARKLIAQYQDRLNMTPVREQELASIQRDYELSNQNYKDLESKAIQSQLATNLEKQEGGQQFRLLEPPSLPELPTSPQRIKLSLAGLGGGLLVGLLLAFVTEFARPTFRSTQEITRRLGAPLVIGLPLILTKSEKQRRNWRRILEFAVGSMLTLVMCAAEVYVLRHP
jgi:polysaccharide chain length determinant protein (PEP-CTERM system associated)